MIFILLGGKFVLFTFVVITDIFGFTGLFPLFLIVYIFFILLFCKFGVYNSTLCSFNYYICFLTCTLELKSKVYLFILVFSKKNPWKIWNILIPVICFQSYMVFLHISPGHIVVLFFPVPFEIRHGHMTCFGQWSMRNRKLQELVCNSPHNL